MQLRLKGRDELGLLALRFEQMARKLKEASEHERNFLMRISHELRTPLTAIQGHVQAIADGVIDGEEEQQASLEIVLAEAERLQRLIGDLLDLARARGPPVLAQPRGGRPRRRSATSAASAQREEARAPRDRAAGASDRRGRSCVGDGDRILQIVANLVDERPALDAATAARSRSTWRPDDGRGPRRS